MELYVGNLPWAIDDAQLTSMFAAHGPVVRAKVVTDRDSGRSRGFGFVTMGDAASAEQAIRALNGSDCQGRALTVRRSEPRPPREERRGFGRREGGGEWSRGPRSERPYR